MRANQTLQIALVISVTALIVVFVGQYALNKFLNTMLVSKLVPFIQKWEGGLSRDPKDTASANPAPWSYKGQTGWHTNKGVTYSTFKSIAPKVGYAVTAENFFSMPDALWYKILENGFMKAFPLSKISHLPRIQAVIISWAWGSGPGGAERYLANFQRQVMGIQDSNITPTEIVENFKKRINPLNEKEWFLKLCDRRAQDFSKMATYSVHGKGWINRLNDFRKTFA